MSAKLAWKPRAMLGSDTATTFVSSTISEHVADATASVAAAGRREFAGAAAREAGEGWDIDSSGARGTSRMLGWARIACH
ncbi:hypothetical protein BamIOP4010DRAFT_6723 [Burkholderia ambifaria IOP40-10]|uniref:Uncharacterized protein n=1 Tax=Burkholderia ambifaria IOP40-10 TaxID=396596 RepID=B1FRR0_9BURK|nr:hypothetical protein BamIOP4010DRAFT_6723 [Burkholderia ambifaria IOP40-10]